MPSFVFKLLALDYLLKHIFKLNTCLGMLPYIAFLISAEDQMASDYPKIEKRFSPSQGTLQQPQPRRAAVVRS